MRKGSILLLDDEKNIVAVLKAMLEKRGFHVEGFYSPNDALERLKSKKFHTAITDLRMPEMDGLSFLQKAKKLCPELPVLVITAFGTVANAVDAIRKGAFDYITKPFEQSEIIYAVEKALSTRDLSQLELQSTGDSSEDSSQAPILFQGKTMATVLDLAKRYASSSAVIFVKGALGTGREILAEYIHRFSPRADQSLLRLNCVSVPPVLIDKELFGSSEKMGRIEMADKGTLFLDEIGEIPKSTQVRLLNFLETGEIENEETGNSSPVDVHLIVGNPASLENEVEKGSFRKDLFYALNIAPISLPTLKERLDEFEDIVNHFIRQLNKKHSSSIQGVEPSCLEFLQSRNWVGNFRELENLLERTLLLVDQKRKLKKEDIPKDLLKEGSLVISSSSKSFRDVIKDKTSGFEKSLIEEALKDSDRNITKTAKLLGISRRSLQTKMKELQIR